MRWEGKRQSRSLVFVYKVVSYRACAEAKGVAGWESCMTIFMQLVNRQRLVIRAPLHSISGLLVLVTSPSINWYISFIHTSFEVSFSTCISHQ